MDHRGSDDAVDVVTIGETMGAFVRTDDSGGYRLTPIGAESNVAVGVANLGHRSRWISRLGNDEVGRSIAERIGRHGVDVCVEWDADHVTGVCLKEVGEDRTTVRYYRSQSAARRIHFGQLDSVSPARWVHLTGITPALSPEAAAVVGAVVGDGATYAGGVSFDVNYRPALWPDAATAAETLLPIARRAAVVFIGFDEVELLLGPVVEDELADLLLVDDDQELVLKRGAGPASVITRAGTVTEFADVVTVIDPTGAGDAFAAGYLAGKCRGWDAALCLRLGHLSAARVLGVSDDVALPLAGTERGHLMREAEDRVNALGEHV